MSDVLHKAWSVYGVNMILQEREFTVQLWTNLESVQTKTWNPSVYSL